MNYKNKGGKSNDPYLPPIGSMDAMLLHFKEMYDSGVKAGFTSDQSMSMVLVAIKTAMENGIQQQGE